MTSLYYHLLCTLREILLVEIYSKIDAMLQRCQQGWLYTDVELLYIYSELLYIHSELLYIHHKLLFFHSDILYIQCE